MMAGLRVQMQAIEPPCRRPPEGVGAWYLRLDALLDTGTRQAAAAQPQQQRVDAKLARPASQLLLLHISLFAFAACCLCGRLVRPIPTRKEPCRQAREWGPRKVSKCEEIELSPSPSFRPTLKCARLNTPLRVQPTHRRRRRMPIETLSDLNVSTDSADASDGFKRYSVGLVRNYRAFAVAGRLALAAVLGRPPPLPLRPAAVFGRAALAGLLPSAMLPYTKYCLSSDTSWLSGACRTNQVGCFPNTFAPALALAPPPPSARP